MTLRPLAPVLALAALLAAAPEAAATVVSLPASKDNTLYESATGALSNATGEYLFTGRTKNGLVRRAVLSFDVASVVPAGSTINSVTLQLHLSRNANSTRRACNVNMSVIPTPEARAWPTKPFSRRHERRAKPLRRYPPCCRGARPVGMPATAGRALLADGRPLRVDLRSRLPTRRPPHHDSRAMPTEEVS